MKLTFLKRKTLRFSAKLTQLMRIALRIALPIALLNTWDYDRKKVLQNEHKQWPPHLMIWQNICTYPHKSGIWYMRKIFPTAILGDLHLRIWKTTPRLNDTGSRRLRVSLIRRVADSRIIESGSRYLIYNILQNLISQKVIKLFEPNFQWVFLYTRTASSPNFSSLALL